MSDETKSPADELAELQKRKADREAARKVENTAAEIERLTLEEKFEAELGGAVGRTFAMVDVSGLGEGFVVLKLGEAALLNAFMAAKDNDAVTTEAFVLPNVVHPARDEYRKLVMRRPVVAARCAGALVELYGLKAKDDQGK